MKTVSQRIAEALNVREAQVAAALKLLDEGATVPFIARYRKEATGGLDDTQLRELESSREYLEDLEKRRDSILKSLNEQGKLTDALREAVLAAETKSVLEDLYLPFKPKRRTKAQMAREAGLEPLAQNLLKNRGQTPETAALSFVDPENGIETPEDALSGAANILVEHFSETPDLLESLRTLLLKKGVVVSTVVQAKQEEGRNFSDYFNYAEPLAAIPSHRALALFRGKKEGVLRVALKLAADREAAAHATADVEMRIMRRFRISPDGGPTDRWLADCAKEAWSGRILPHLETQLMGDLRERAEEEAIRVFARNLRNLLLAPPAGRDVVLGLDPGFRTGVKLAVVDATGRVLETGVIYPHAPQSQWAQSLKTLEAIIRRQSVRLVSIGNGTASRETEKLARELSKQHPDLKITVVVVSEAGASVYSASETASGELPDLDVSLRGAVSIARRLQDPLAELVKIEPKAIGVGQYQHDVNQTRLERMLETVVQDCVNAVGVDVNTASPALLTHVSGLSPSLARNIVALRDRQGAFRSREALKEVPKLGPKAFEQAAGFLRIPDGNNPLDASAVHPEAYPVVRRILTVSGLEMAALIGDVAFLRKLNPADFTDERFQLPTVQDILAELEKPGRDPRPEFKAVRFREDVETIADLKPGMRLEGVVTNVTNFGAFVDIGVHQDGLVHISMMADRFVKDPHSIVKTGDIITVQVVEVDPVRKRIALSIRESI